MAKNRRDFGSDALNAEATSYHTVFVDTSLDTHLVLTISSSDTVYDFKEKMIRQHSEIFPKINGVMIHSVQVKRLGHFYHLPDSMLVSGAFGGSKKAWFVFVEASCSGEHSKELVLCGAALEKDLRVSPLAACSGDDDCRYNNEATAVSRLDELTSMLKKRKIECIDNIGLTINKKNKVENKLDSSVDASGKVQSDMETRKIVGELCDTRSSDTNLMIASGANKTSESETILEQTGELDREQVYRDKSNSVTWEHMIELEKVPPPQEVKEDKLVTGLVSKKDKKQKKILSVSYEQLAISQSSTMLIGSVSPANLNAEAPEANKHKEPMELVPNDDPKLMLSRRCNPLVEVGADGTNNELIPSLDSMGTSSQTEAVGSVRTKKKKTKTEKKVPGSTEVGIKITDPLSSTVVDLGLKGLKNDKIVNDQSMLSLDESQKTDTSEKEMVLSRNHNPQVQPSESVKPSDQIEAQEMSEDGVDGANNLSVASLNLMGTSSLPEAVSSVGTKKKKTKTKKKTPGSAEVGTKITAPLSSIVADLTLKDIENDKIVNDQSMLSLDESQKNDTSEKEMVLSHNHDPQLQPSESVKPSDQIEAQEMSESGVDGTNKSVPSLNFMGTSSPTEAVGSVGTKKKKTRTKKKIPGTTEVGTKITAPLSSTVADLTLKDLENDKIVNDQSMLSLDDSQKNDTSEKEIVLSHNHDSQLQPSESVKPSDQIEAQEMSEGGIDGTTNKSVPSLNFMETSSQTEAVGSVGTKKKKTKTKKKTPGSTELGTKITAPLSSTAADLALKDLENDKIVNGQSMLSPHESQKKDTNEKEIVLSHNHDPRLLPFESVEPSDQNGLQEMNEGGVDGTHKSVPSLNFMGTSSPIEAVGSVGTKKRKTKTKKKTPGSIEVGTKIAAPLSSTVADLALKDIKNDKIVNDQSTLSLDESHKNDTSEKEIVLSLNHHPQVQPSVSVKPSDQIESQEMNKGSIPSCNLSLPNEGLESGSSGTIKRKKLKAKKSAAKLQDKSDIDNLHETYLPAQGVALDVEMNDGIAERNKATSQIDKLKYNSELSSRYEPEGNKILDSTKETLNEKASGFAEMSLDQGIEAGKSGHSRKKKKAKLHAAIDEERSPMEHSIPVNASPAKHIEGGRGLCLKNEPEVTSSKASKTSDLGEVTVNCSESGFTGQKLDNENGLESVKSGGSQKKKRSKKHTNSVCDAAVKHFASETEENQSTLSGTVEKEKSKKGARDESSGSKRIVSPLADPDQTQETVIDLHDNLREAKNDENMDTSALQDHPIRLQANELQQLLPGESDKEQVIGENIKKKVKKPKRNMKNVAETQSNSKFKRKNAIIEDLEASGDKMGDWDPRCDSMDRSASAGTRTGNKSTLAEVLLGEHAGVGSKCSNPEADLKGACSSEVPSYHSRDNNMERRPETGDGVNFRQYFVSEQQQIEGSSSNKVKEALHSTKAKRETKKPNFVSDEAVKASQVRHNIDANQLEESSADAKGNKDLPLTNKDKSEAYGDVVKASKSHDVDEEKTPQKSKMVVVANGSGSSTNNHFLLENNGSVTASSSSSSAKGSKRTFQDTANKKQQSAISNKGGISSQNVLRKNDEDIVNSSQQKKSLLNAPGAIFSDESSESSGNENHGNSDASPRTPSDHSSSSGFSDGESELSQGSRRTGLGNSKKEDGGRKSSLNSKHPDPREMSMGMILKSSKRFKKAKLTAVQSQEADPASQPIEFVPDSQANQ